MVSTSSQPDKPWWDTDPRKETKEKPELETKVEQRFVRAAKKRGWKTRKLNGLGNRSWQDQLVLAQGLICLIEFKRPGSDDVMKGLTAGQEEHYNDCLALGIGHLVLVTDSSEEAIAFVENLCKQNRSSLTNTKSKRSSS